MRGRDSVQVCVDLERFGGPAPMGGLHRQEARSGEVFAFEYELSWLERDVSAFDPDLALVTGSQYPASERENFGIFLDSSPDRWGRVLMQRRENLRARREGHRPRALTEWDFLLGVHDETRLGALRFRAAPDRPFLDADERQRPSRFEYSRRAEALSARQGLQGAQDPAPRRRGIPSLDFQWRRTQRLGFLPPNLRSQNGVSQVQE